MESAPFAIAPIVFFYWREGLKKLGSEEARPKNTKCMHSGLIYDHNVGEIVCDECGLVLVEQMTENEGEWYGFALAETKSRCHVGKLPDSSVSVKNLSAMMDHGDSDEFERGLPLFTHCEIRRLRRWQRGLMMYRSTKNLVHGLVQINNLSKKICVPPPIEEKAAVVYRKAFAKGLLRQKSAMDVVAASLYLACRMSKTPRTLREIATASAVNKTSVARHYRLLLHEFNLQMPIASPMSYISKVAEKTEVSCTTLDHGIQILKELRIKRASLGRNPAIVATTALYIACLLSKEKKTQAYMAKTTGFTEVTLRNTYRALENHLSSEFRKHHFEH
jgi:transcription initiation factor TFIIB